MLLQRLSFVLCTLFAMLPFQGRATTQHPFLLTGHTIIYTSAKPGEPLYLAVLNLQRDIKKVLGTPPVLQPLTAITAPGIVISTAGKDKLAPTVTGWEAHRLYLGTLSGKQQLILEGADMRGTIYAIYTFSEKVLSIPPLWYYSGWQCTVKKSIQVPAGFAINCPSPQVKYRAFFPNDMDLFTPWRKLSANNNEEWLEMALRLKFNTIEWFDGERDYSKKYNVSPTTRLISDYGLIYTTHHHSPLNATLAGWEDYWKKTRDTLPPELSLANVKKLEEFWKYNVECIVRNKIDMLWVIGFRANGDHPFWFTFKDAPAGMKQRGEVISQMMERQQKIVIDATGNPYIQFRTIFYDELSDLLAQGYIHPPTDSSLIWTYVAARRDHYPNKDIQQLDREKNISLGYYFNYQFTSTGSHLAAGEGPWKMEQNFRYVAGKSARPISFSVVNAGNIREFVLELSANAAMMWDFDKYHSDDFLNTFCATYYGSHNARRSAALYRSYYHAFWQQRKPDLPGFDRQYIFQDLRYKRAILDICTQFNQPFTPNPLKDIGAEQVKGRTFRIVPSDNGANSDLEALIKGTTVSAAAFLKVARRADVLYTKVNSQGKALFNDNLRQPAYYLYYLNQGLLYLCKAYQLKDHTESRNRLLTASVAALKNAEAALHRTQHGPFTKWYAGDEIFGFKGLYQLLNGLIVASPPATGKKGQNVQNVKKNAQIGRFTGW